MAQFRSTADILDLALQNAGEVTNGNSPYETQALNYLNRVHYAMVAGGTIPLGKDTTVQIDEAWPWARARSPLIIELQPKVTGSVTFTLGSEVGTFSVAPAASLKGYHIYVAGKDDRYKIATHTAASTAMEIDGGFAAASGSYTYTAIKLDYELIPDFINVNSTNDKVQFQKAAGVTLTGTLTQGVYSPSALATHVATVMTTAASGPTITGAYSAITRKFTLTSDLAAATSFYLVGSGSQADFSVLKTLGYDDETSSATAASFTSTYVLGGMSRLIEPFRVAKNNGSIFGLDMETMQRDCPVVSAFEGPPTKFTVRGELPDGTLCVRFNAYVAEKTRVEVEHVAVPRDLKDNSASIPLIPRKHVDILEDAATFYLMLNKNDDRAQMYANLLQGKIMAMISQHRGSLQRSGENFGQVIPRRDLLNQRRRFLFPTEPY